MSKKDWETDGTRNGTPVFCTVNAYGDCPYCDKVGMCHIADPIEECDDFAAFFDSWDDWEHCGDEDEEDRWLPDDEETECGFNPYMGGYDYDC